MKVIKQGKKHDPLLDKKITCGECGCQFQLESEREAKFVPDQHDGDYYEIPCPQCHDKGTYSASLFQRSLVD